MLHVIAAILGVSFGQIAADDLPAVQAWFDGQVRSAESMPALGDASIAWRLEITYSPDDREMAELRQAVAGHPDHPQS
jgi:hypothetical protein